MNLPTFCIRRPVFTILLMAAICVGGLMGYSRLAVSALPRVDFPTISVSATLPGASPETMASSVATPLERQFSTIAGITSMTSTSFLGSTQITLQFDLNRNIDGAALDVQSAISTAQRRLPEEMTTPPSFQKVNPADQPILFIAVSSDTLPLSKVNDYADTLLAQRISTLPGVAQVQIYGAQKYAVRIQLNPDKIAQIGASVDEIRQAVAAAASNTPIGTISGSHQLYNIQISGQPSNGEKFAELVVLMREGAPVRLREVATVTDAVEDVRSISYFNGKQAVTIAIQRQPDANTVDVVKRVRALLPQFRAQLPPSIEMTPTFDRSVSIAESLHDVQFTLLLTIALVVAVIYAFLRNWRATFIPAIAVPLSIIATYGGMYLMDFSINNISLLAITLSVGFVVDDAIVMLENIMRYVEEGMQPFEAALKGASEIGFTIISITLSLVAVFIPVLFMGGIVGRLFQEFAVTISMAVLISAFVSLTLTPMLAARMLKANSHHQSQGSFANALENTFLKVQRGYEKSLHWALRHRLLMLGVTLLSLLASIGAFYMVPKDFFPLEDNGFVFSQTRAQQDISYEAMVEKQKRAAEIIAQDESVDRVFYAVGGGRGALNSGRIFFGLKPRSERESVFKVIQRLQKKLSAVEGLAVNMQPVQNIQTGPRQSESMYQYTLQGTELQTLYDWAGKVEAQMRKAPEMQGISSDLQLKSLQVMLEVDQQKAASLGVSFEAIRQTLYSAFGQAQVATLYTPSNDYAVIMELQTDYMRTPEDIRRLYVKSDHGGVVPLEAMATITRGIGPLSVNHQGQLPSVTLSFNNAPGYSLSDAVSRIDAIKQELKVPETIITSFAGAAQIYKESTDGQGMLILLTIVVIYIILGMLYESFIHPVTILSGLPSAGLGAVLTLLLFNMTLSIIAVIGVVLLIGIVKKNAIMMIDFAITARAQGMPAEEAIERAAVLRFRPIMMTTLAAIFGTLPIALGIGAGAELRAPLGVTVVGGLLTSQLLTLYITPVIYLYLDRFSREDPYKERAL